MNFFKKFNSPLVVALIVFLIGSGATYLTWHSSEERSRQNKTSGVEEYTNEFISLIQTRFDSLSEVLHGTISLAASQEYTQKRFTDYIDSLQANKRYPSIDSLGYIGVIKQRNPIPFIEEMSMNGFPITSITPPGIRDSYTPLVYTRSIGSDIQSNALVGFDLQTDDSFKVLLEAARDTGKPRLSNILTLASSEDASYQPGVVLIVPIYAGEPATLEERKEAISGYMYVSIRIRTLIRTIIEESHPDISVSLYEGNTAREPSLLFGDHQDTKKENVSVAQFDLDGRTWTIAGYIDNGGGTQDGDESTLLLILGILLSGLLAIFLVYVMRSKSREMELQKQLELKSAKDNLLSLASHQLRTPATSVKQYIGMVREGYVGDITPEQEKMLSKADESNERQLSIVNQILNLSKLETWNFQLQKKEIDIIALVNSVIQDQARALSKKSVTVQVQPEKIMASVDPTYFRMVIENLVTNAAKYSHDDANVSVQIEEQKSDIVIKIVDTGIGIAEEDFKHLFILFNRIDTEFSLNVSGTGIGLYISKLIVNLHGGNINVESILGEGSTFIVTIPKQDTTASENDE